MTKKEELVIHPVVMEARAMVAAAIEPIVKAMALDPQFRQKYEKTGDTIWYLKGIAAGVQDVMTIAMGMAVSKESIDDSPEDINKYIDDIGEALSGDIAYKLKEIVFPMIDALKGGGN